MKNILAVMTTVIFVVISYPALAEEESLFDPPKKKSDIKVTIDESDQWLNLFNAGVKTGKRYNSYCKETVTFEVDGGQFSGCLKMREFLNTTTFKEAPGAFRLGVLSVLE